MSKEFSFTLGKDFTYEVSGLYELESGSRKYFYTGITKDELEKITDTATVVELGKQLVDIENDFFILFVFDKNNHEFYCFNDRNGHNEIYLFCSSIDTKNTWTIKSVIHPDDASELDYDAVNEYFIFHSVLPPRTMYRDVQTVPMASYAVLSENQNLDSLQYERYWQIEDLFNPKATDYEKLTEDLRDVCYREIKKRYTKDSGIALSGGIDSGGILGMMRDMTGNEIKSFSFGPHGPQSNDLESARKTAAHFNSTQFELYPSNQSFEFLFTVLPKMSQPVPPDILLPLCHIFNSANSESVQQLYFGYGTQANLGNLYFNRMWHRLWLIDLLVPTKIRAFIYQIASKLFKLSKNQKEILMSNDWIERFIFNQGALFTREKHLYKKTGDGFMERVSAIYRPLMQNKSLKLSDRFVLLYLFGWTHHSQERDTVMIANNFNVDYYCPFNTRDLLSVLLKAPDKYRKKNKWNKQLWRDALKSFVPAHLYMRKGKSLVVPYSKLMQSELNRFLPYLSSHTKLPELVDLDWFSKNFEKLPEPGLCLIRLVSFCIWYDSRHDLRHLSVGKQRLEGQNLNFTEK